MTGPVDKGRTLTRVDLLPQLLKPVGVVARIRHHGDHGPGARVEGDDRALALTQGLRGRLLHRHVYGQLEVCALVRLARDLVPVARDTQDPRLTREIFVVHPLDSGPSVHHAVVAQPRRRVGALGIGALEVVAYLHVAGQQDAVGREYLAPLHLHLFLYGPGVGRLDLEVGGAHHLPVGELQHQGYEEQAEEQEQPADRLVHATSPPAVGRPAGCAGPRRSGRGLCRPRPPTGR